ncbi:Malonyl CoA-acyl carrier protein transacylase [Enhygromyxa salina]|uniref:Malonyl CoA-acyl carrier protein transacylase n=1 Tax=Enhygromyxa salina TaxID=215803 RepID=A0A0C2CJY2_9BACT|nr:Malonyl CoA-acyl carrier protein transacylase [Enhygromyxa salina]
MFNIAPREAQIMDPQERLFLETTWHTLEDAGYPRAALAGERVGVFVGAMYSHYQLLGLENALRGRGPAPANFFASIANRVSFYFDFRGPSLALDTMCSSSLTALHLACASLSRGEVRYALVGGVNLMLHPSKFVFLSQARMSSSDGRCRAFAAGADGYVPGEGVGAVLLKPLADALRDDDRVLGLIRGTALNHGGRTSGYAVPSPRAQAELMREALRAAQVDPGTISYVEAHGTGTSLGDPIEVAALTQVFAAQAHERGACALGTVKSNIGHLEPAAGIAGLTKVLLQLRHRSLAPTLHAAEPNPAIDFETSPFVLQTRAGAWVPGHDAEGRRLPLRAAISSFGAGGANAHVIIEEAPPQPTPAQPAQTGALLFPFSATHEVQLRAQLVRQLEFLRRNPTLDAGAVAWTLQTGREALDERACVLAEDLPGLIAGLERALEAGTGTPSSVWRGRASNGSLFDADDADVAQLFRAWAERGRLAPFW